ncbi:hypothetical protein [Glaciecola sp. SC05]|uniref:hypothetical protein n=1 Tax=Glaciecola sp. SC05 TaxID=1987355 RepID=UPI00352927BB
MFKFLFLIPVVLCVLWYAYLNMRGYSVAQGKQGFTYIIVVSTVVLLFFTIAMLLSK